MPPKKQIPAPIDRPLSRAYLREFTGWSTAYPPGVSDSTSLRVMENILINRDGSCRIRPGLRYMSFEESGANLLGISKKVVGTHEPFFLADGSKAYLFAVREDDLTVGFRVLAKTTGVLAVHALTDPGIEFTFPEGATALRFSKATTYVKYLQIDNKIFALSNANEAMRYFTVGDAKTAKPLQSIERPDWTVADKLTVVHPAQSWINGKLPTSTARNYLPSPRMDDLAQWTAEANTAMSRSTAQVRDGTYSMALASKPARTNMLLNPIDTSISIGVQKWSNGNNVSTLSAVAGGMEVFVNSGNVDRVGFVRADQVPCDAGQSYRVAFDLVSHSVVDGGFIRFNFYTSAGAQIGDATDKAVSDVFGRRAGGNVVAPKGAVTMRIQIGFTCPRVVNESFTIANVVLCKNEESNAMFSGASGTNYFWTGTVANSSSVYHPPADVAATITILDMIAGIAWIGSIYARAGSTVRSTQASVYWQNTAGPLLQTLGTAANDSNSAWTRYSVTDSPPAFTIAVKFTITVKAVPRGETHYVDSGLFEKGGSAGTYFDGGMADTTTDKYFWEGDPDKSVSVHEIYTTGPVPPAATKTANTLISSTATANQYSFGFFYTFSNEIGESAASQMTVVRTQRGWPAWRWETANAAAEPSGTSTNDPGACADQLAAYMPQEVFQAARDQGAVHWSLYMFSWSDQDPVPVMAMRVDEQPIEKGSTYVENCWLRATPQTSDTGDEAIPIPRVQTRRNYSEPSHGAQGIIAADRMVLVNDRSNAAVIRWSSAQQGSYTDFSASRGGGYKTLTSGNLFIPACVKLWQNPQSTDTLTILCLGTDGMSTGYYMSPAQVASQSEATNIMGFEETTATPGTVSPFGCEVMNNALYHPIDEMVMKSTATNYNINHKSITDQIQNVYLNLVNKQRICSSVHDGRIYYLVQNPGRDLEDDCRGNEVWVFDAQAGETGTWSCWAVGGVSLRKIEQGTKVYMSLVRPDGIYYFDQDYTTDDVVDPTTKVISQRAISWKLETNTQGANRAHDAWAHLQQANIMLGYFQGTMRYGIRSFDINGRPVEISKLVSDDNPPDLELSYDVESFLLVRKDLREWFFFAESVLDDDGVTTLPSSGQISLVQYRYTPVSVNVGYEYGSVETFEYGRALQPDDQRTTTNGVPKPYVDVRRP